MDGRWAEPARDAKRDFKVFLHPRATIHEVRTGVYDDPSGADTFDLTDMVSSGTQSTFECNITLHWRLELFGLDQPRPNMVLEIQAYQNGTFKQIWLGIIDSISSYTVNRGERSMQLIARSREQQPIWKETKRVTPLYPQLTDMAYIARRVALSAGMNMEEILIPMSAYQTAHSNTQMSEMSAWEMLEALMLPQGWTPFMDGLGRLRVAYRELQGREPDIVLDEELVIGAKGSNQKPSTSRVRVVWLDPVLKKALQQGRKLAEAIITMGWFLPFIKKEIYFSDDKTQRAQDTYMDIKQDANFIKAFLSQEYKQLGENNGKITLINYLFTPMLTLIALWANAHNTPDGVTSAPGVTSPVGRKEEAIYQTLFTTLLLCIGTGIYEIWGTPYEWVHARNITEVFNNKKKPHEENPLDLETDFIINEGHAQAVAVRELIYRTRQSSTWTVQLVDDFRLEFGDVVEFPDRTKLYVEDFKRDISRDNEGVMEVQGFLF